MDETEGKAGALDVPMTNSASTSKDVVKPKRRSLVERELETNMTEKVTSIVTNGDVKANISRYGRFRRVKTDPEFSDTDKAVSGYLKSPASQASASPVYKMYPSNSPTRPTEAISSSEAPTPVPLNIEVQIESIENKNLALSRFSSEKKKVSQSMKHNKGYTTLDLSREMEKTASILKHMFSPTKSPYSSNTHLNNILERSSDKYSLEKDDQKNGYVDNSSVVKTLDFDTGKKKKKSTQKLEAKTSKNNGDKNSVSKRKRKSQPLKEKSELSVSIKECDNEETKIPVPKTEDSKSFGPKKEETANTLSKSELFEMEAKCLYQVGDMAWSRVGTYPFWPCIVTRDPFSETFVRKKMFGRVERDVLHVNFFGDNGRRGWIVDNMLRTFTGLAEFESTRDNFTREDKKKDPRLYAAFFVSDKKMEIWNKAVQEAETIHRQPKRLRIDGLNELLCNTRIYKPTPKKSRGEVTTERLARTDSDVSLSESLYDTLFSEDDTKNDDVDKTGNRKKSLDVSDVVTACLDNIAVKTGISVIQKQSHMDIWLQKAKSKTPEKPQPKIDTPLKTFVETKANSSKKSKNTPAKVTSQKPYPLRRSGSDLGSIRITRAHALNEHNYAKLSQMKDENGEDISSTDIDEDNKQTTDEDVPAETKLSSRGIGTTCKVETECMLLDKSEIEPDCGIPVAAKQEISDSHLTAVASKVLKGTSGGSPSQIDMDVDEDNISQELKAMKVEKSELDVNDPSDGVNTSEAPNSQNVIVSHNNSPNVFFKCTTKKGTELVNEPGLLNGAWEMKVAEKTSNELGNGEITHDDEVIDNKSKRIDRDENANNETATHKELTEQAFLPEPTKSLNGDLNDSHEDIKYLKESSTRNKHEEESNVSVDNSNVAKSDKKVPLNVRKSARISKIFYMLDESDKAQNEIQNSPIANNSLTSNEVQNNSFTTTEVSPKLRCSEVNGTISTDVLTDYNNKEKSADSTQTLNEIEENPNKDCKEDSNTTADNAANNVDKTTEVNNKDDDSASKEIKTIDKVQTSRVMGNRRGKYTKSLVDSNMQADAKIKDISENSVHETFESNSSPITDLNETENVTNNVDIATEGKNKDADLHANKERIPVVVIQSLQVMMKTRGKQKKSLIDSNMDADTIIGDTKNIYDYINEALESHSSPNLNETDNVPIQDLIVDGTPNIATNEITDSKHIDVALLGKKPATNSQIDYVNKTVKRVLRLRKTKKNATNVESNLQSDDQTQDISEANNKIIETLERKLQADKSSISYILQDYDHLPNIPDYLQKETESTPFQHLASNLIPNTVEAPDAKNELTVEPKTKKNIDVKNGDDTPNTIDFAKDSGMLNLVDGKTVAKISSEIFNDCLQSSIQVEAIKITEPVVVETNNACKLSVSSLDLFPEEKIEVVKMFTEDMKMSNIKVNKELAEVVQSCQMSTNIDVKSMKESLKKRLQSTDHVDSPIAVIPADKAPKIEAMVIHASGVIPADNAPKFEAMEIHASGVALNVQIFEKETPTTLTAKKISVDVATNSEIMTPILMDTDADLKSDTISIASSVDDNIPLAEIVRSSSKEAKESAEKPEEIEKPRRKPRAATETEKKVNKSKEVNKAMEEPEFIKYLELRQDALIDENPHVSPDDVVNYLYKTWLYEQNLKSDHVKSDDIEQSNLVKGLADEPAGQPKKPRKRAEKKERNPVINEEIAPKDKSKRNIAKRFYYEDDDIEEELQIFEIFKKKPKSTQVSAESVKNATEKAHTHTDIAKTEQENITEAVNDSAKVLTEKSVEVKLKDDVENLAEEEEYDEAEFFLAELLKTKPNLFKGLVRERVCEICESPGNLVKCKGLCAGMFHVDCANKEIKAVAAVQLTRGRKKKKPRGRKPKNLDDSGSLSDEKSHDISEENSMSVEESLESNVVLDADKFEEGLALKMKELSEKEDKAEYVSPYSSDDELKWDHTVAGKCEIVDVKFRAKQPDMSQYANFKCKDCQTNDIPKCFVCKLTVSPKNSITHRQRCNLTHCHKYYHIECLDHWPQTQFNSGEPSKNKKVSEHSEALTCPRHVCHTCVSDDPRGCRTRFSGDKLARCVKCPATYHSFTKCLPAGSKILSASHIICPRHYEHRPGKVPCHVNTGWCFICALGGTLICCEYCPTSFHAECLNIKPPEGNYMCEECETGRLPLYGEMVWVKLGHYRWWPGIVLHPSEIPDNIMVVKHTHGEFVVRFFGQYDHYWVNRGRVFPFQEGDSGRISTQKSKIDEAFLKAMDHAKRAYEILKDATPNSEEDTDIASSLLPPHYVKLKVNKPCGSLLGWRGGDEENSITLCDCDPHEPEPCGPQTQCLNRMLLTECGPTCRAGERCCNRAFERRLYPKLTAYRTPHRGWGLKTLEDIKQGEFVIEYVGELIDESEFRRRMQRMNEVRDENYYFLTLDKERMIDAGPKGNLARFMNHCCEPNCETQKWTVLGDVRVGLFARQDIPANQEVTFNYNLECNGIEKKACLCGARLCSGYIGAKPKQEEAQPKKGKLTEKRKYRKRKPAEESPSTSATKPRTPKPRTTIRSTKPRELTEIEKDLLIINNAANGISSDSESSGRFSSLDKEEKGQKAMKRKRVSFSTEDVTEVESSSAKKLKLEGNGVEG